MKSVGYFVYTVIGSCFTVCLHKVLLMWP